MSGSKTTTMNQTRDPYAPAVPTLNTALAGANSAYGSTYNGSSVAAKDPNVTAGQDTILGNAASGNISNLAGSASSNIGDVMGNGGLAQGSQGAMNGIGGALGTFNSQMGQATSALTPYANGSMRGSNPYLNDSIDNAMTEAANATNRQFSSAGRYGSGAQSSALGNQLGQIATNARMNAYNTDTQNQLGAATSLGSMAGNGLSGNISGNNAIAGLGQQGFANTLNGLNSIGTLNTAQNTDAQNQMTIGGQNMSYNQQQIDAANQDPWTKVGNLAQIGGGIAGLGGTTNGTATQTQDTGLGGIIGGALGGLGALKNMGGLAGIGSLFTMSDIRTKENIQSVGALDNGLGVYSYNYKGDIRPQIGLLAQEVERVRPEAVATDPRTGIKAVRYDLATRAA
jgi:hypothetical protein